jgi:hypothetical protein
MLELSVSEVARRIGARPRDISDLFYQRELSDDKCPIVGGRRLIPPSYIPVITATLLEHGFSVTGRSSSSEVDRGASA